MDTHRRLANEREGGRGKQINDESSNERNKYFLKERGRGVELAITNTRQRLLPSQPIRLTQINHFVPLRLGKTAIYDMIGMHCCASSTVYETGWLTS